MEMFYLLIWSEIFLRIQWKAPSHLNISFKNSQNDSSIRVEKLNFTTHFKANYHQKPFNKTEFELNYFEYPLAVSKFCFKYDFSLSTLYYYNETAACISNSISNASKNCFEENLEEELANRPHVKIDEIPSNKLETYTRCLLTHVHCPLDVKRFLAVNLLANYPNIIRGTLESYIEHLLTTVAQVNPTLIG